MRRGVFGEQRVRIAAHADYGDVVLHHVRHEAEQLVGLSGIGEGEDHVVLLYHAQVAVEGVERIDEEARCACG